MRSTRTCILGLGNDWASDDGAGPAVVRRLQEHDLGGVTYRITPYPDPTLVDWLADVDALIVVDAVSSGAAPGTIHHLDWRPGLLEARGIEQISAHGFGLREVLALAESLGRLPDRVTLWGVEVAATGPGPELSPPVAAAVDELVRRLTASPDCLS